eukprot:TRINITY_DN67134_c0_g1_i1.p1 TRINITY_DN67134_c0_g1~~TRINITY_DN67134_c0_g1_i1.p1  ORF type:complete len:282 (+),score=48.39 TRINITY_DN67134_c0_g1_i1:29-847(+)
MSSSSSSAAAKRNVELLSGAVGGPLVVGFLTPQRNAMTLAAKDVHSSFFGLYRQVFAHGPLKAFRGGSRPTVAAMPQFTMIGPAYLHVVHQTGSAALAVLVSSLGESLLTFSAQRRNAQIQYNAVRPSPQHIEVQPVSKILGPGFSAHIWRNAVAMMGIRIFSPHMHQVVEGPASAANLSTECKLILSDFGSSMISASLSMPFNHVFSFASCTPELQEMTQLQRLKAYAAFLIGNYQSQGTRLLCRDLCIRICYTGFLFTGYHIVERKMKAM